MSETQTQQIEITKDWTIGDLLKQFPQTGEIISEYGLHCVGCHVNYSETLEQGLLGHGLSEETLQSMLKDLNKAAREENSVQGFIKITEKAAQKVNDLLQKENKQGWGLRIGVTSGGCSGMSYSLQFQEKPSEGDEVIEAHNTKFFVASDSKDFLKGVKLDFVDTLQGSGFKVSNPNASHSCGCGQSFH